MFCEMMEKIIINYGNIIYNKRDSKWPTNIHARALPRRLRKRNRRRRNSPTSRASCARARSLHQVSFSTISATAHPLSDLAPGHAAAPLFLSAQAGAQASLTAANSKKRKLEETSLAPTREIAAAPTRRHYDISGLIQFLE